MNLFQVIVLFLATAVVAAVANFYAIAWAGRLGFVARPDPTVPNHLMNVPLLGGVGVLLGTMLGVVYLPLDFQNGWPLIAGALGVCTLGAYKDRIGTSCPSARQLVIQAAAIAAAVATLGAPSVTQVVWIDVSIAMVIGLWLLNSINFLDVMDGLAGGTCLIACVGAAAVFAHFSAHEWMPLPLALAGGLCGFLVFNLHPARIFMGDIGSFGTGFVMVVIWLQVAHYGGIVVSTLLIAVPLFELLASSILRLRIGISPLTGDGTHISLLLLRRGKKVRYIITNFWIAEAVCVTTAIYILPKVH